eukprot:s3267_g2.t1
MLDFQQQTLELLECQESVIQLPVVQKSLAAESLESLPDDLQASSTNSCLCAQTQTDLHFFFCTVYIPSVHEEKLQGAAAEHPLGSLVGKLELFWIHEPGDLPPKPAESAVGLVCFQFVQGHAAHYARVLHLSVTRPEALQSAVLQARHLILETLPVKSLRVTVLAAEDDAQHICIDPHVERAYHQCGFRWFQLTQKLRRKKSSLLRHRKKRAVRFLVLHSQRGDADPPAPRNEIGTKAQLLLQSQTSEGARESPSAIGAEVEPDGQMETLDVWDPVFYRTQIDVNMKRMNFRGDGM